MRVALVLVLLAACAPSARTVRAAGPPTSVDEAERTFQVRASRTRPYEPLAAPVTSSSVAARPAPQRRNPGPRRAVRPQPAGDGWARLRQCESGGNYAANTGNGFYGAYQFSLGTWRSVGGSGLPSNASPAEQDARALMLYTRSGRAPWPVCGRWLP